MQSTDKPRIAWIEDEQALGETAEVDCAWNAANPGRDGIPDILKCFSPRPHFLRPVIDFSAGLHH